MTEAVRTRQPITDALERGRFSDGTQTFSVRASSEHAPDSFQVYLTDAVAEIVLVISGLNAGMPKATWGLNWVTASEEWRKWCEAEAFMIFYNGKSVPQARKVRTCNG